ncbi:MAG: PTS sugar transporter subunit IIA [Proteobacteria bacterium]|nr:PTS sugar transporter subunit IIA [Pseudomonadota bacterium]
MSILDLDRIQVQASVADKAEAIQKAGELLVSSGCVQPKYVAGMLTREESMSTYLDNGVSIPHGMQENKEDVIKTAISVLQIPEGVEWEPGEMVYLVVGIAASSDDHISVLEELAEVVEDEDRIRSLWKTEDPGLILKELVTG